MASKTSTAIKRKGQFLWINKDISSSKLSNSRDSRDLLYAIHSHVRPKAALKRKSTFPSSPRSPKRVASDRYRSVATDLRDSPSSEISSNLTIDEPGSEEIEELPGPITPESPSYQSYPAVDPPLQDVQEIERDEPAIHAINPQTAIGPANSILQSTVDPFDCAPCKFDTGTYSVMQYHLNFSRFYLFRNEAVIHNWAYKKHLSHNFIQSMFLGSLQHPMHFHSLAAATATRMSTIITNNSSILSVAAKSMQSAVQEMRSYFANLEAGEPIDPKVIMDVMLLCMAAWFRGDLKTARVHLRPLQQLTKSVLHDDSTMIMMDMVSTIDLWVASELGIRPLLQQFWHPEAPSRERFSEISGRLSQSSKQPRAQEVFNVDVILTPEEKLRGAVGHLEHLRRQPNLEEAYYLGPGLTGIEQKAAIGFAEAVLEGIFNPHMTRVLQQYLPYCALHTHIWLDGHPTPPQINWVNRSCKSLIYQTLSAQPPLPCAPIRDWLSEIARLVLIMHLNYGPNPMAWRMQQSSVPRLKEALVGYEQACLTRNNLNLASWQPTPLIETRLIFWAETSGVYASHEHAQDFEWFVCRATKTAKCLGIRNYLQLHLSMGHFGHCDTLHLAAISTVLERLKELREKEAVERERNMKIYLREKGVEKSWEGWNEVEDDMRAYLI